MALSERQRLAALALQKDVNTLSESLRRKPKHDRSKLSTKQLFEFIEKFERLNSKYYLLKKNCQANDRLLSSTEEVLAFVGHDLLRATQVSGDKSWVDDLVYNYRRVWRENFSLFLFTLSLFVVATVIGFVMTIAEPDYGSLFVDQQILENIIDNRAWFASLQSNPIWGGLQIAWNNIRVSIIAYVLGGLLGVGGIYILAINGLMLGSIFALTSLYDFDDELLNFVVGHGPLELTMIVTAVFGGLIFGRVFYQRPIAQIRARMKIAVQDSMYIFIIWIMWLVVAAFIEAFISPWPQLSSPVKLVIGILVTVLFWVWTFRPIKSDLTGAEVDKI